MVLGSAVAVFIGEALIVRTAGSLSYSMFVLNWASVAGLAFLAIGITNRVASGVAISLYLFLLLEIANALKLYWLLIPVYPNDVRLLPDLVQVAAKPALFGTCFYQASYRAAVRYRDGEGSWRRGGYFVRSETNHPVMRAVGNALAEFKFHDFGAADMVMLRDGVIDAPAPKRKIPPGAFATFQHC